ncbi:MAG: GxxExxY protein [Patescibacteria group bacterium]|nr:GxxExxY protein [Patescibacteria group bacterium]
MLTLDTDIINISRVGKTTAKYLNKLGITTVRDLLFYFPFRYDDFTHLTPIDKLQSETSANIVGRIELIQNKKSWRRRMYITEALITDDTETLKVIWFNQPFIARNLQVGDKVSLAGKIEEDASGLVMKSPTYEKIAGQQGFHTQGLVPNYHLTANLTQKQIRFLIKQIIGAAKQISDWLPPDMKKNLRLFDLSEAIAKIHFPKTKTEIETARRRLSFNELFIIQLQSQLVKKELEASQAKPIPFSEETTKKFVNSLPWALTDAQRKSAWEILKDIGKDKPMSRLLSGDVGSGKTVVALIAMLNVALNNYQAVLMAPTEILAHQHYSTICQLLSNFDVKIGLITGSEKRANYELGIKNQKENKKMKTPDSLFLIHNSDIIIGTHALIQEKIEFNNLGLAIIDEQHRFGVEQRAALLTRTYADRRGPMRTGGEEAEDEGKLLYEKITYKIRGAIFNVKKQLGLGHKEVIYQKALEKKFEKVGLSFTKEKSIEIKYDDKKISIYRPDFIIDDKVILEIKKLPFIGKFEKQQVWHYLKGSEYKLALLVNFANNDVQIERFVDTKKSASVRQSPHQSALSPHLLSMTATPIPRSLALALYGDLDLSIINQLPKGRKPVMTKIVPEEKREKAYAFIRQQIDSGRQVFVICPLIDHSDKLGVKSVKQEFEKLDKQIFPDLNIGILHGRIKPPEKEKIMREFLDNKIKILVSTSVVEVGVDAPNAAIMMIEGAERFGLAQLHQFRGRVGRSQHQSYCFLFTENSADKTLKRLETLVNCQDGFTLAKMDLKFRGAGEIYGTAQKGFPQLKIASLFDYKLMKEAREEAIEIINKDPGLKNYPLLAEKLGDWEKSVHLE